MVNTGLDVLVRDSFARLKGLSVGLLAHPASVDKRLRHALPLMHEAGVRLAALFGPEHGITGDAQDMIAVEDDPPLDPVTGARLYSLYGSRASTLRPTGAMLDDLDVLVVDLQDVGSRYYTFAVTMGYAMEEAAERGLRLIVLDRPNPLGGRDQDVEGPGIDERHNSFVGAYDMPIRHGLTIGEYALWVRAQKRLDIDLEIVKMDGWRRDMAFEATQLPWVLPSPNMPTVETAWVYPGQCLLEGTNMSEGRGTTRPFELCGAPYLDQHRWAERSSTTAGSGVVLRPTVIRPTFHKHAGQRCGAVQIHLTDRWTARPLRISIALLEAARALAPSDFKWREEVYEFVGDRLAIDLLFGSDAPRKMLEAGATTEDVVRSFRDNERAFVDARRSLLLYS
jgi:uncharacterized protein YbbC (DUF1343 family)